MSTFPVRLFACVALLSFGVPVAMCAQESGVSSSQAYAAVSLPEAPSALLSPVVPAADADGFFGAPARGERKYRRTIQPGQIAPTWTAGDKMKFSVINQLTLGTLAGNLVSAGYGQLADTRPHYGVDKAAFGQRLGAASLKGFSQSVFSNGIYASVFHDDPRYYVMGSGHSFKQRAVYSASRMVVTRKDDGSSAVNWSKLAGITSASALANAYYPERDRTVSRTATSVLTSIAIGAALNEASEFMGDIKQKFLHKK